MFRIETQESKTGRVVLKNVDRDCAVKCIDYLYTGEASIPEDKIGRFLHVAHMLQLPELCSGITELLTEGLNSTSFFETKRLANTYDLEDLERMCDNFAKKNFAAIAEKDTFSQLEKEYIEFLLGSSDTVGAETIKFDALLKWIHGKPEERDEMFPDLLELISLTRVPPKYYRWLLENEPLVYNSASIQKKFTLSVMGTDLIRDESLILYDTVSRRFYANRVSTGKATCDELMGPPTQAGNGNFAVVHWRSKVFVLASHGPLYSIEYERLGAQWKTLQPMTKAESPAMAAVIDGTIYVIGSRDGQQYDIDKNVWTPVTGRIGTNRYPLNYNQSGVNMLPITNSSIVAVNGMIYVIGGLITEPQNPHYYGGHQQQTHGIANVDRYDPKTSCWSQWTNMNNGRYKKKKEIRLKENRLKKIRNKLEYIATHKRRCSGMWQTSKNINGVVKWQFALKL